MAIIEELNDELFIRRFEDFNRLETEKTGGNFTRQGLRALFEYLNNLSEDTGKNIELDVIALCCDFAEYKNLDEYLNDYSNQHTTFKDFTDENSDLSNEEANEEFKQVIEEEISENTTLIKFADDLDDGFIIQQF